MSTSAKVPASSFRLLHPSRKCTPIAIADVNSAIMKTPNDHPPEVEDLRCPRRRLAIVRLRYAQPMTKLANRELDLVGPGRTTVRFEHAQEHISAPQHMASWQCAAQSRGSTSSPHLTASPSALVQRRRHRREITRLPVSRTVNLRAALRADHTLQKPDLWESPKRSGRRRGAPPPLTYPSVFELEPVPRSGGTYLRPLRRLRSLRDPR